MLKTDSYVTETLYNMSHYWDTVNTVITPQVDAHFVVSASSTLSMTIIAEQPVIQTPVRFGAPITGRAKPQSVVTLRDFVTNELLGQGD